MTGKPRSTRATEEELRRALDFAGLGTWRHDLVTDEMHMDDRARELFGFDRPDISTDDLIAHVHPERQAAFQQGVIDAADPAKGVDEFVAETRMAPPGQDERWLALNVKVVDEPVGKGERHRVAYGSCRDITERVLREKELQASREFLDSIIELSPYAMWISDDNGNLLRCNQALRDLLHLTDEQIVGKYNVFEDRFVIDQGFLPLVRRVYTHAERAQFRLTWDNSIVEGVSPEDVVSVVLIVTISPVVDAHGHVTNAIIQHMDITDLVRKENALRTSERRMADIIEFLPDATMVIDKAGTVVAWNRAMEELTGIPKAEMLGRGDYAYAIPFYGEPRPLLADFVMRPEEDLDSWYESVHRSGRMLASEKSYVDNPHVGTRNLWATATPLFDAEDNLAGAVETIRDITERVQAEAALRDSERRLADIIESLPDPTFVIDVDGVVIAWNRAMEELTGVPKMDMLGRGDHAYAVPLYGEPRPLLADLVLAPQREVDKWYPSVKRVGNTVTTESLLHLPASTGGKYIWVSATPLYDARGKVVGAIEAVRDMTDRALAEIALRESESKYRSLFENTMDGCALCQMIYEDGEPVDYIYLDVNPAFKRLTGLKDPVGKRVTELIPGIRESNPEMFAVYGRVAAGGPPEMFETYIAPLGIWSDAAVHSPDEGRFVVVFQTINERKAAEVALRESERGLREAEAVGHLGHWTYRFTDGQLFWSDELFRILGREPGDEIPDPGTLAAFAHPDDMELIARYQKELVDKGEAEVECRIVRPDGTVRDTYGRGFLTEDAQGLPQTFGVLQDITERKRAEEELREREANLQAIMANTSDLIASYDRERRLVAFNQASIEAFRGILGLDIYPGLRVIDHLPASMLASWQANSARALDGESFTVEFDMPLPGGGRRFLESSYQPIRQGAEIVGYLTTTRDVTERRQAEDELRQLTTELEDRVAQRTTELQAANAELEAFSYSVSHDLRAPLRHVSGYTDLLERRYGDTLDEQAHHYMETISKAAQGMGVLIDDLLKFSRAGRVELQLTTIEMDQLVREAIDSLESTYGDRSVNWGVAALPTVQGDRTLLRQVWVNLLSNAVKYTRTRAEAEITVEVEETPQEYEFRVSDNGVGFDMRYADKLFGVFQRLHSSEQFEGTGIGLANVRRIITRMGGRVWAEAIPDEGATFHFTLPRRKEQESWST